MTLLVTLYLIMMNTFTSIETSGPQDRSFGIIEIWMIGCQSCIFVAMLEYAFILYKMKNRHFDGCHKDYKNKRLGPDCCKYKALDNFCFFMIPISFLTFNVVFWLYVISLQ